MICDTLSVIVCRCFCCVTAADEWRCEADKCFCHIHILCTLEWEKQKAKRIAVERKHIRNTHKSPMSQKSHKTHSIKWWFWFAKPANCAWWNNVLFFGSHKHTMLRAKNLGLLTCLTMISVYALFHKYEDMDEWNQIELTSLFRCRRRWSIDGCKIRFRLFMDFIRFLPHC